MGQQDLSINELVGKIERGDIRLPEMQRQYVWQSTRVRDLIDSLYRGYPSGTILTWETDEGVATRDFSVSQEKNTTDRFQLLLDGQQRLTSLSAILRGEPIKVRGRKRPIDLLFNLEHPDDLQLITEVNEDNDTDANADEITDATEEDLLNRFDKMAFVVYAKNLANLPHWVSVSEVFQNSSDTEFLKKAGVTDLENPLFDKYTSRLKKLRDIKNYEYRVHVLEREKSYEEVTEIFVRVNSLGAKLRSSDLALAQITAKWRNSLKIFQAFEDECSKNQFPLDLSIHLKNLVVFATGQSRFRSVGSIPLKKLKESWNEAKNGMRFAINFLQSNVGIDSPALLSSPFLVIALAKYGAFKDFELTPDEAKLLRYWVLIANAKARYSRGSSESFLDQDLTAISRSKDIANLIQLLKNQVGRLEILPSDLESRNSRSAYFKTMFMAFRDDDATDWRDQLKISLKHSGSIHSLQFHHLFPQAILKKKNIDKSMINDICNLSFISGRTNKKISANKPSNYLPEYLNKLGEKSFTSQCIPLDTENWKVSNYELFLENRRKLISTRLNDFISSAN